jgi:hypothetical protein
MKSAQAAFINAAARLLAKLDSKQQRQWIEQNAPSEVASIMRWAIECSNQREISTRVTAKEIRNAISLLGGIDQLHAVYSQSPERREMEAEARARLGDDVLWLKLATRQLTRRYEYLLRAIESQAVAEHEAKWAGSLRAELTELFKRFGIEVPAS